MRGARPLPTGYAHIGPTGAVKVYLYRVRPGAVTKGIKPLHLVWAMYNQR